MRLVAYSGAGNRFLLADNREGLFPIDLAHRICAQAQVDGLILVESCPKADAYMRTINKDGSEAEMCGNGLRCFVKFLQLLGVMKERYSIYTLAGMHTAWIEEEAVAIEFPACQKLKLHVAENLHFVNTGVPHAVTFVDSVAGIDVTEQGKVLRFSPLFAPAGANIDFVSIKKEGFLMIRTYERGVEAETLACGTGVVAAALIAHALYDLPSPIDVCVRSGDMLQVAFQKTFSSICLKGPAEQMNEWELTIDSGTKKWHLGIKHKTPIMACS